MRLKTLDELRGQENGENTLLHISENVKLFALRLAPGKRKECGCSGIPPEVVFQGIEGKGTIFLDNEPFTVKEGDVLLCPAGKTHRLAADKGETFGVLVFKPLKQD